MFTMKKSLFDVGILMLCAQLCLSKFITKCRMKNESESDTNSLNQKRMYFAEEYQIANMHALKYDPNLEKTFRQFASCDSLQNGVNHRFDYIWNEDDDKTWKSYLKDSGYKGSNWKQYEENLHPLQTRFIICEFSMRCQKTIVYPVAGKVLTDINSLEMFGPIATIAESDFKHGKPGSKCPNGVDENMLCKEPKRVVVSTQNPLNRDIIMRKKENVAGKVNSIFMCIFVIVMVV